MAVKRYGWIPDLKDHRDFRYSPEPGVLRLELPSKVDLRPQCPPVYNQGTLGSCTANAITALYEFTAMEQKVRTQRMSRLFHYYNTRLLMNTVQSDSGASIRQTFKAGGKYGFCLESTWPYTISRFKDTPIKKCYDFGAGTIITQYARVQQDLQSLKLALAQGDPLAFGFSVYESFESRETTETGICPFPAANERLIGGHAILAVGYDDELQCVIFRNSWGVKWGDRGYGYMPYELITNPEFAADFWTLRKL